MGMYLFVKAIESTLFNKLYFMGYNSLKKRCQNFGINVFLLRFVNDNSLSVAASVMSSFQKICITKEKAQINLRHQLEEGWPSCFA